jgi:hypothetical protein
MDGETDAYAGFCSQVRPQMTSVPTLDLPARMPADELYEPNKPDAEAGVTSEDEPMINSTGADATSCQPAGLGEEDAPVVNLQDQEAQSIGSAFNCTGADAETGLSEEDAPVVNLQDQEAQSIGSSTDDTHASAAASTDSVNSAPETAALPVPPATHGRKATIPKKPIRGQALTALPAYRRIRSLKKDAASSDEWSPQQWLKFFLDDAWEVQTRAMLHVCGPSCWKYNKSGTKICRHHCYHIVTLQPDDQAETPAEKELKMRRDGRPLNNQLYIMEDQTKGKRGRICPISVCCFETMSNYVAACGLRCNFDNQSLLYLPPQSVLPLEWAPNIGSQLQYSSMNRTCGDLQPKWLIATDASSDATTAAVTDLEQSY